LRDAKALGRQTLKRTPVHSSLFVHRRSARSRSIAHGRDDGDLEGTFRDETREGSFRLKKQLDWDAPRNAP